MIPVRIEVEGFLCYRDRQVINLEGCDLWVLSGRNGSGKSTIFDAMTFALFKSHRGGKSEASQLIHTEARGFTVVFEFDLNGERYRLRRAQGRTRDSAERQLYRRIPGDGEEWPAVPETSSDKGLDQWITDHLGFTYETFTSSVLLMQGQAERLISSKPKDRHDILSGLVDLAWYKRLFQRAEDRRQARKAEFESAKKSLSAVEEISDSALESAAAEADLAESLRIESEKSWQQQVVATEESKTWRDLVNQRQGASSRSDRAREVLARSSTIVRDAARYQELKTVLPLLIEAGSHRVRLQDLEIDSHRLTEERDAADRKLDATAQLIEENRQRLASLGREIFEEERLKTDLQERALGLGDAIERAKTARDARVQIEDLRAQLSAYPADLTSHVGDLKQEKQAALAWKAALPILKNLNRDREALRLAQESISRGELELLELRIGLTQVEADREARRIELESAKSAERSASDCLTRATTQRDDLARRVNQFQELSGRSLCDRCGQELTPAHFDAEADRLHADLKQLILIANSAEQAHRQARKTLRTAQGVYAQAEAESLTMAKAVGTSTRSIETDRASCNHLKSRCDDHYASLEDSFRIRIASEQPVDWRSTSFPMSEDLDQGQRAVDRLAEFAGRIERIQKQLDEKHTLEIKLQNFKDVLSKIPIQPGDDLAETERDRLQVESRRIEVSSKSRLNERIRAEADRDRLIEHDRRISSDRARADKDLAVASNSLQHALNLIQETRSRLPESWLAPFDHASAAELDAWSAEAETLRAEGVESLSEELARSEDDITRLDAKLAELDERLEGIPLTSRLTDEESVRRQDQADLRMKRESQLANEARSKLQNLRSLKSRRQELVAESVAAEKASLVAEKLAKLLGRNEIQRFLLREAERGIIDHANPILREISGGELQLRLQAVENPDVALAIEAEVRTHGRTQTHEVVFLSGSQKFRVAVSLALAIGQYARGKRDRPIESVVIDEGFGCLDRQGRDEMIAQLKALKGRLSRIVLVSHQEDFADSFPDGYRFEIVDGSTVALPFHR